MRNANDTDFITDALTQYSDTVRRICFLHLKNYSDVEDAFQDVFLKLLQCDIDFENDEHKKAWICRVTVNKCKDIRKSFWRSRVGLIEEVEVPCEDDVDNAVLEGVLSLPEKYKDVVYLFYYEGYTVPEISKMISKKENTIYSYLHRARELLKEKLKDIY